MQNDFYQEIKALILDENISNLELLNQLENYHDSDIADVLEDLTKEERLNLYQKIGVEKTSDIFEFYENVEEYIDELEPEFAADIVERMDSDDAVEILNELEEEDKEEIIKLMEPESKNEVLKLDKYDEDVIGSYMSDNYILIDSNQTIKEAMSTLIKMAGIHDNISTLYVEDENKKFFGAISLNDLIVARKDDKLIDLVMTSYPSFYDDELIDDCIEKLKDYAEASIPVLNRNNEIIGVITSDNVIDATEDVMEDDYAKLGGLSEAEELDESIFTSVKKRIPWLILLLFLGFVVSTVTGIFESVIAVIPVVVFFQSMVLDMAGNVGTQSLAVTIRSLSQTDDPNEKKKHRKTIFKELRVGITNALIVSIIAFIFIFVYLSIKQQAIASDTFNIFEALKVTSIISGSLLVAMTLSSLIGTVFPIFLNAIHIDPAVASGPFITTINDIIAIVIYYGLVYLLFILV